jgi:hypothetical protein
MKTLREEIRKSIEPNAKSFYDEKIIVDKVIEIFEKRIDSKIPQNPIDTQYKTGYYNAICDIKEILK